MRTAKFVSLLVLALAAALASATAAPAATTIGSTPASSADVSACAGATLFVQDVTANASPRYDAPTAGVITSWSVMGRPANTAPLKMKVVRETAPDTYTIVGTTAEESILMNQLNTFPTRISVNAGDKVSLWIGSLVTAACFFTSPNVGDSVRYRGGNYTEPVSGEAFPTPQMFGGNARVDVSAQLEPDADGDGFGDESQDACPELASTQLACPVPETTITLVPKKLKVKGKKKAKATFEFSSDVAGSTFACSLDGGAAAPCTSPFTAKVKKGTHTFEVAATSALGRVDATPATSTFKVKKKKRKK